MTVSPVYAADSPAIAVAANVKFAMDDIAKQFTQDTGRSVRLSYGSSGNFVSQILHGAPFELLLSADELYPNKLVEAGITQDAGHIYAMGRLALAASKNSPLELDEQLLGLSALIESGQLQRFAIANPAHAPYGESAQQVLTKKGLWQIIQPHVILGENASQAAQFAVSGSTQGGIVPLSLVLTPNFQRIGQYVAIADELYQPINQRMVLMKTASSTAQQFYTYMLSDSAQQILLQYGFKVPDASSSQTSIISPSNMLELD
ncbi:molybdate ABC transporter substrate-binding protein [Shewanella sp. OMA3-2]|uniref:molybdate ABC transporter substrate-binding protein n=1 Tax=Shewanella sp. OMA3-2 TaxID=2908650 RepID=UPI001F2BFFA0|nr:molybdate ABC transporter substrate-binding protein [Shewanella sp. OMA3-2]UJF23429.1 molybdate ABC transporter substrate-binding protein [Shewanella sp. OMA3-2]